MIKTTTKWLVAAGVGISLVTAAYIGTNIVNQGVKMYQEKQSPKELSADDKAFIKKYEDKIVEELAGNCEGIYKVEFQEVYISALGNITIGLKINDSDKSLSYHVNTEKESVGYEGQVDFNPTINYKRGKSNISKIKKLYSYIINRG